jgi:hypothetical protein
MPSTANLALSTEEIKASRLLAQAPMGQKNRDIVRFDQGDGPRNWGS